MSICAAGVALIDHSITLVVQDMYGAWVELAVKN